MTLTNTRKAVVAAEIAAMFITTALTYILWNKGLDLSVFIAVVPVVLMAIGLGISHCRKSDARIYASNILGSYVWVGLFSMIGLLPIHTVIVFMTIPVALGCSKTMLNSVEGGEHLIADIAARTGNLFFIFSVLLSVSFVAAYFI